MLWRNQSADRPTSGAARVLTRCAVLPAIAALALLTGCGGSSESTSGTAAGSGAATSSSTTASSTTAAGSTLAAMVPEDLRSKGTLKVATDATYPPLEYIDEADQQMKGIDPDLIQALADKLGLKVELVQAKFDGILPGLTAGKYDMAISGFADRKEREEIVDMVTYMNSGEAFFVRSDLDPGEFKSLSDLCGHKIAVLQGTENARQAHAANKECGGNVTVMEFPDQNAATLAVTSGRADLSSAFGPVASWIVQQSGGRLKLAGTYSDPVPLGIVVPKDSPELSKAVLAALKELMADGTYQEIMQKWHVEDFATNEPVINGAIS